MGQNSVPIEKFLCLCYNFYAYVGTHAYETCSRRRGRKCIMTIETLYYVVMMTLGVYFCLWDKILSSKVFIN